MPSTLPADPAPSFAHGFRRRAWSAALAGLGPVTVEGVWPDRPCVVVANHTSHLDTGVLIACATGGSRPRVALAADYWFESHTRRAVARLAYDGFPVHRRGGGMQALLAAAVPELTAGRSIIVFPEGTRSRSGEVGRFRSGAFVLAAAAGVPVLPVGLRGPADVLAAGEVRPRRGRIEVQVGTPLEDPRPEQARLAVLDLLAPRRVAAVEPLRRRVPARVVPGWAA